MSSAMIRIMLGRSLAWMFGVPQRRRVEAMERSEAFMIWRVLGLDLLELEFAALEFEGVNGFSVDADDRIFESRVLGREVEIDTPERLFFIVAE